MLEVASRRNISIAILSLVLMAIAACGGSSSPESNLDSGGPDGSDTTLEQMMAMVLGVDDVNTEFSELKLDGDISGLVGNDIAAGDLFLEPGKSSSDVSATGRRNGYRNDFVDFSELNLSGGTITGVISRPFGISSGISVFRDSKTAAEHLSFRNSEYDQFEGMTFGDGSGFSGLERYGESRLPGDQAFAITGVQQEELFDIEVFFYEVNWSNGAILARLLTVGPSDPSLVDATIRLAERMDARIETILGGS